MDGAVAVPELDVTDDRVLRSVLSAGIGIDALSLGAVGAGHLGPAGQQSILFGVGALGFSLGFVCAGAAVRLYGEPLALSAVVWFFAAAVGTTGIAILTDTGPPLVERGFLATTGLVTGLVVVLSIASSFHVLFRIIDL